MSKGFLGRLWQGMQNSFRCAGAEVVQEKFIPIHQLKATLLTQHLSGDDLSSYEAWGDLGGATLSEPLQKAVDQIDVLCQHGLKSRLLPERATKDLKKLSKILKDEAYIKSLPDSDTGLERVPSSYLGCGITHKVEPEASAHVWHKPKSFRLRVKEGFRLVFTG